MKLPTDYESCADCGFDHEYEPIASANRHRSDIHAWMMKNVSEHVDECGEVNCTSLVEAWDSECADGEATLNEDHPAWEIAFNVSKDWEPVG